MTKTNNKWKTIKELNKTNKQQPPSKLVYKNRIVTSPIEISNIACNYFKDKINKIREGFNTTKYGPMQILNRLIPPVQQTMGIKKITRKQTLKLIDRLPNSFCTGYDDINNNIIKKLKYEIEPYLTHLINQIIELKYFQQYTS